METSFQPSDGGSDRAFIENNSNGPMSYITFRRNRWKMMCRRRLDQSDWGRDGSKHRRDLRPRRLCPG